MEHTLSDELTPTKELWHWVEHSTLWNDFNLTWGFGSYLQHWFLPNKTNQFLKIVLSEKNSGIVDQLKYDTEHYFKSINDSLDDDNISLNGPLLQLLSFIAKKEKASIHKTIQFEKRGHLLVFIEKVHSQIYVSFFSKNFNQEAFLIDLWNKKRFLFDDMQEELFINLINKLNQFQESLTLPNESSQIEIKTSLYNLPNLLNVDCSPITEKETSQEINLRTSAYAKVLTKLMSEYKKSFFESITDYGLGLVSEYDALRIHLLKFLAILPCLEHDRQGQEVKRLFLESLTLLHDDNRGSGGKRLPWYLGIFVPIGIFFARMCPQQLLAFLLRQSASLMAQRFIAGEDIYSSLKTLKELGHTSREATLDQLGELVLCREEADHYLNKVLELIDGLKSHYKKGERNSAAILKAHVSVKTTALGEQLKAHAYEDCYNKIAPRLTKILNAAREAEVFINIDAEHYHFRDIVWKIYSTILKSDQKLYRWKDTGIVVQAYLTDGIDHLNEILEFQRERKILMPIRLVKGAYWDAETIEAKAHSFEPPQFLNKIETDLHFRQLSFEILSNPYTQLVVASHNVMDHCYVESLRTTLFPNSHVIEHQCLHMTFEALSASLAKMGYVVRNYMPVGNLLVGMAYLVRRIMENSSQVGVLKMMRSVKHINFNQNILKEWEETKSHHWNYSEQEKISDGNFQNHAPLRMYEKGQLVRIDEIRKVMGDIWSKNGGLVALKETSINEISSTMNQLHETWYQSNWRKNTIQRALCLLQSAELMIIYRDEISNCIMHEAFKSITEAYADVDEAIDFINFYVRNFFADPSFENSKALGVVAAITPWNFPFAIPAGMCVAPLVAGNAVILKSAEQTPQVAHVLAQLLHYGGIPTSIFKHVVGKGETVGHAITLSDDLHGLVFTGSANVGTMLYKNLAHEFVKNKNGDVFPRIVITEMGGKNPIIVTQNAELDETISGILYSAFAHAGQKCSACSRVIVHKKILASFKKRLLSSISSIKVGHAFDPAVLINPVISDEDKLRLLNYKKLAGEEALNNGGKILLDLQSSSGLNQVGPLVIEIPYDIALKNESFSQKEAFGPIIHLISYDSLDDALKLANATPFALTAGLYSQSPTEIEYFCKNIYSGNVYINRPNTGARVGIEPFGGFKLSGTGPKAGGVGYVKSFVLPAIYEVKSDQNRHQSVKPWSQSTSDHLKSLFPLPNPQFYISNTLSWENILPTIFDNHAVKNANLSLADMKKFFSKVENTFCPGQQSYSLFTKKIDLALYLDLGLERSFYDQLFFQKVMQNHIPLIIAVASKELELHWEKKLLKMYELGYPKDKVVLWSSSLDRIYQEISHVQNLDLVWIAVDSIESYDEIVRSLKDNFTYKLKLPAIYSQYSPLISNLYSINEFEKILFNERSYAVNIMRHGAPLE